MSATEVMEQPHAPAPPPGQMPNSRNNNDKIILWVVLGIIGVGVLSLLLLAGLLVAGRATVGAANANGADGAVVEGSIVEGSIVEGSVINSPADEVTVDEGTANETDAATPPADEETAPDGSGQETAVAPESTETTSQTDEALNTPQPALTSPKIDAEAEDLLLAFSEAWSTSNWERMATFAPDDVVATAKEWGNDGGAPLISQDRMEAIFDSCYVEGGNATSCTFLYAPPEGSGLIFNIVYADSGSGLYIQQLTFNGDAG